MRFEKFRSLFTTLFTWFVEKHIRLFGQRIALCIHSRWRRMERALLLRRLSCGTVLKCQSTLLWLYYEPKFLSPKSFSTMAETTPLRVWDYDNFECLRGLRSYGVRLRSQSFILWRFNTVPRERRRRRRRIPFCVNENPHHMRTPICVCSGMILEG